MGQIHFTILQISSFEMLGGWTTFNGIRCILLVNDNARYSQLREQVNNVRVVVSPLWRGAGNIHGFILDGKSYRQG